MAEWPARGQQAPNFWDTGLRAYIDEGLAAKVEFTDINGDPLPPGLVVQIRLTADLTDIDNIVVVEE